jgi:hypothetical protein
LDYLNGVGQSVLQGLQQLKMYVFCGFLYHISAALSNYVAINVLHYGINGSAAVHVMRQFMMIGLVWRPLELLLPPVDLQLHAARSSRATQARMDPQVYGYIWKFFKDEQKAAAGGKAGDTIDVWGSVVKVSDWRIFSKHSFYLLLSGYFGVADQQINTILISRMGSVDLAGNSLIGTMMSCKASALSFRAKRCLLRMSNPGGSRRWSQIPTFSRVRLAP